MDVTPPRLWNAGLLAKPRFRSQSFKVVSYSFLWTLLVILKLRNEVLD